MSHLLYDFLVDSELFNEQFLSCKGNSIDYMMPTLQKYVDYCAEKYNEITEEIKKDSALGIRSIENPFGGIVTNLPLTHLMSQSILQDLIILPDPLFAFCIDLHNHQTNSAHSKYLGFKPTNKLEELRQICQYMKDITPFIVYDVVKFFPDYTKAKVNGTPILYSPTGFSELFEENVLKWLHQRAKVYPMHKTEEGLIRESKEIIEPCPLICVEFDGSERQCGMVYSLLDQEIRNYNEVTGIGEITMRLCDTPIDKELFDHWKFQSINKTAHVYLDRAKQDAFFAANLNAKFSPQNNFICDLITKTFSLQERDALVEDFVNPVSFGITVPSSMDAERFLKIRSDTASLLSFRIYLSDKLNELSSLRDPNEIRTLSKEIETELNRKYIPQLKLTLSNVYKKEALYLTSIITTMGTGIATHNGLVSGLICLGLAATGLHAKKENIDKLKAMPAYFWNKVSKK